MYFMQNKRGLSDVVTLFLIILLTVVALVIILVTPRNHLIENATTKSVLMATAGTFFMLIIASLLDFVTLLPVLFIAGIFYGFSLIIISPSITRYFSRSNKMASYTSYSQAFGRAGTILSSLGFGLLIDFKANPFLLLFISGILGLFFVFLLSTLKKRWAVFGNIYSLRSPIE